MLLSSIFVAAVGLSHASPSAADARFDWDEIEPSWDLEYTPCYGGLQCARLLLPLDWHNPEDTTQTVAIAIAKLPAQVDAGDEAFGATVITNPGGPGDSGVIHMIRNGHYLKSMFDGEKRRHEILSFDPRGMYRSTPIADCYRRDRADSSLSQWQLQGFGLLGDSSTEQFRRRRAHATAFGQRCALADKEQSSIREHMSTASVARDMLAMVGKIEELRRKEMRDGSEASKLELRSDQVNNAATEPRIQYYGTSYGTVLGNTFLSMFPGRVHRMVLDGLVVGEDYVNLVRRVHSCFLM
jgi:pimeloyl-ACP methyl ester carboxylesterase